MNPLRHLDDELAALASAGLLRESRTRASGVIDLCSNDYLGYASEPWAEVAPSLDERHPADAWGRRQERSGAGGSRLVVGDDLAHEAAERALALWLQADAALLFTSGYCANVGVVSALARPGDLLVSDALNHASIIDGCRLSGATVRVTPHRDVAAVERALADAPPDARRRWVVTESYFSMDGTRPDLRALRGLCDRFDAGLIVDEAHALGVLGPEGRGECAAVGVRPDVLVGTAGKALGLQGAFAVGSRSLRAWLWNRARSFVFSTGMSPAVARCLATRVARVRADDAARGRLHEVAGRIRAALASRGADLGDGDGHIIPWVIGSPRDAVATSRALAEQGVLVQAIRPPTVPEGSSRLRITASAGISPEDLARALDTLQRVPCTRFT